MCLWVRSCVVEDQIIWIVNGWKYLVHSERGVISWFAWDERARHELVLSVEDAEALGLRTHLSWGISSQFPEWHSDPVSEPAHTVLLVKPEKIAFVSGDPLSGFPAIDQLTAKNFELEQIRFATNTVPIWMLVLPVTLLSSYLILWNPKKRVNQDA
ncbi:MAG: hypothetical protein JWP89_2759 [Schlesneria sp.]|nr:hypothetical protein [Schlesneria sp.]